MQEKNTQLLENFLLNGKVMHILGDFAAGETPEVTRPLLPAEEQKGVGSP